MEATSVLLLLVGGIIGAGFSYFYRSAQTFDRDHGTKPSRPVKHIAPART